MFADGGYGGLFLVGVIDTKAGEDVQPRCCRPGGHAASERALAGELGQAARWVQLALERTSAIRSARLDRALATIRAATVDRYPNEPTMRGLLDEIHTHLGGSTETT